MVFVIKIWFEEQSNVYSFHRLKKFQQYLQSYWDFLKAGVQNINIEEFLRKNTDKEFEEKQENEKQLLQEENKNGKN